uniref:AIG1-type G domain-containing protein n=1 Tax=Xiphophorus couchianus TaxID=32473 RepID=A0A3B5KX77_9TELE
VWRGGQWPLGSPCSAWKYSMILFTHGDKVEKSDFDEMLKEAGPELKELLEKAGNRYHVFNNLRANDRRQKKRFSHLLHDHFKVLF